MLCNSCWLMAPFYLGLVVSLAVQLLKFLMMPWAFILHAPGAYSPTASCTLKNSLAA